jgi:hypothetical protein
MSQHVFNLWLCNKPLKFWCLNIKTSIWIPNVWLSWSPSCDWLWSASYKEGGPVALSLSPCQLWLGQWGGQKSLSSCSRLLGLVPVGVGKVPRVWKKLPNFRDPGSERVSCHFQHTLVAHASHHKIQRVWVCPDSKRRETDPPLLRRATKSCSNWGHIPRSEWLQLLQTSTNLSSNFREGYNK